ncbi:hypothetical protein BABINDRAFT_41860, partial [Babjeviella inositovora NRRL Y-12698]
SFNKYLSISAKITRSALKPNLKVAAEKRGLSDAKVVTFKNGAATSETKPLSEFA